MELINTADLWRDTRLLTYFDNYCVPPEQAAIVLEQQRLFNETLNDVESDVNSHRFLAMFRRMSIPIVTRIVRQAKTPELVKFSPITNTETIATQHMLKSVLPDIHLIEVQFSLDEEAELVAAIAQQCALEIDLYVLHELRNNAGTVAYIDPTDPNTDFVRRLHEVFDEVQRLTNYVPNWIVASSEVAEYLPEVATDFVPAGDNQSVALGIRYLGLVVWEKHKQYLFENTFSPEHELLLGCRYEDADTFAFCPKVLLQPVIDDKRHEKRISKARLRSEFEIRWPQGAGQFYARVNVKAPEIRFD